MSQFNDEERPTMVTTSGNKHFGVTPNAGNPVMAQNNERPTIVSQAGVFSPTPGTTDRQTMVFQASASIASVAWLYCWKGLRRGTLKQMMQERNEFGRDVSCNIEIEDPHASSHHGAVLLREGKWFIMDFASANGTFVNEKKLGVDAPMPLELHDEDVIRIGESEFVFKRINR